MIKACVPISPIPNIENNLKNHMLRQGNVYTIYKKPQILSKRRDKLTSSRFDYSSNLQSNDNSVYLLERINACMIEILPPRANSLQPKDLIVLSSLVSLYKKGQICFPPDLPPTDKDIIAYPLPNFTRRLSTGGLENITPCLLPDGGECKTQMVLMPFKPGPHCCPFLNTHFTFKVGELWF